MPGAVLVTREIAGNKICKTTLPSWPSIMGAWVGETEIGKVYKESI